MFCRDLPFKSETFIVFSAKYEDFKPFRNLFAYAQANSTVIALPQKDKATKSPTNANYHIY